MSFFDWLFCQPSRPDYYYRETYEEAIEEGKRRDLMRRTTFNLDSTEEEVQHWLRVFRFDVYKEELKGYDGRRLLLMSKTEEQELTSRLQGSARFPLMARIACRRVELGITGA
jgi:hypothetical protein